MSFSGRFCIVMWQSLQHCIDARAIMPEIVFSWSWGRLCMMEMGIYRLLLMMGPQMPRFFLCKDDLQYFYIFIWDLMYNAWWLIILLLAHVQRTDYSLNPHPSHHQNRSKNLNNLTIKENPWIHPLRHHHKTPPLIRGILQWPTACNTDRHGRITFERGKNSRER